MKTVKSIVIVLLSFTFVSNLFASNLSSGEIAINSVIEEYLKLKHVFFNSNSADAKKNSPLMVEEANKFLSSDYETTELIKGVSARLKTLVKSSKLEEQRKHFQSISDNLYNLMGKMKTNRTLFRQYCPMAFGVLTGFLRKKRSGIHILEMQC
jgi:hypothetical protein